MADKQRLRNLVEQWKELDDWIKDAPGSTGNLDEDQALAEKIRRRKERRRELAAQVFDVIVENPRLADNARQMGFTHEQLDPSNPPETNPLRGSPTPTPSAGPPTQEERKQNRRERDRAGSNSGRSSETDASRDRTATGTQGPQSGGVGGDDEETPPVKPPPKKPPVSPDRDSFEGRLGVKGKDFILVKRGGKQYALYTYNFGGNKVEVLLSIPEGKENRYGIKSGEGQTISNKRFNRAEVIGSADELPLGKLPKDALKETQRYLRRVYGSSPVTDDDEVMAVFIGAEMLGWSNEEIAGGLRRTPWFKESTEWERHYVRDLSPEARREEVRNAKQDVVQSLENAYGREWMKHLKSQGIKNPMKQIDEWSRQIASGEMGGDPAKGLERFFRKHEVKARDIEGTPAWMDWQTEQEEIAAFSNRPEDRFEALRAEAMDYLGQDKDQTPRLDRATLQKWAGDLVTGVKSEGDWQQFLRNQMKTLFPYFDPNIPFIDQASSYKSTLERVIGTDVHWADDYLRDFTSKDTKGNPTGAAMSLFDYEQHIRDNDPRFWENPSTEEKGRSFAQGVLSLMAGVS